MPSLDSMIRYVDGLLLLGGVPLPQFPGYEISPRSPIPFGLSTVDAMVLRWEADPLGPRTVRAALFADDEAVVADPGALIDQAERGFGACFAEGEVLVDDTVSGPDRRCVVRVRTGPVEREDLITLAVVGVVVAAGTARPSAGVVFDAPLHVPVARVTREVADLLCRPVAW